jgi:hypothetical protein
MGQNGEEFDEVAVLEKSKKGIVVAIFVGLTAGSFKGHQKPYLCSLNYIAMMSLFFF